MPLVSVVILTFDEELNLSGCIASLCGLDAEVFVIDSGSTDRTKQIAIDNGAALYEHAFETQARQFNWALDSLPLSAPWIMRLDADERLTPELVEELRSKLPKLPDAVSACWVKRRVYFLGQWIRYGGYYPTWLLRVWRRGKARYEDIWMDEHLVVSGGNRCFLDSDIIDENRKGLAYWIAKHNCYSDREVKVVVSGSGADLRSIGGQAARRRFLKERVYWRTSPFLRAFLYWGFRYFVLLGFLDGRPGLVFHFLQGFWYRFVVDAKLYERGRINVETSKNRAEFPRPAVDDCGN
jgi:glycosyltransferase involved in cell wall biosynthesis